MEITLVMHIEVTISIPDGMSKEEGIVYAESNWRHGHIGYTHVEETFVTNPEAR